MEPLTDQAMQDLGLLPTLTRSGSFADRLRTQVRPHKQRRKHTAFLSCDCVFYLGGGGQMSLFPRFLFNGNVAGAPRDPPW